MSAAVTSSRAPSASSTPNSPGTTLRASTRTPEAAAAAAAAGWRRRSRCPTESARPPVPAAEAAAAAAGRWVGLLSRAVTDGAGCRSGLSHRLTATGVGPGIAQPGCRPRGFDPNLRGCRSVPNRWLSARLTDDEPAAAASTHAARARATHAPRHGCGPAPGLWRNPGWGWGWGLFRRRRLRAACTGLAEARRGAEPGLGARASRRKERLGASGLTRTFPAGGTCKRAGPDVASRRPAPQTAAGDSDVRWPLAICACSLLRGGRAPAEGRPGPP